MVVCVFLLIVLISAASAYDLYLIIGQSNAAGRDRNIDPDNLDAPSPEVKIFTNDNQVLEADQPLNRYSTIVKKKKKKKKQGVCLGLNFGKRISELTGNPTLLVVNARGATRIGHWLKGRKGMGYFEASVERVRAAQEVNGTLRGILWHQGEGNTKSNGSFLKSYFTKHLPRLIRDYREEFGPVPFLVGQLYDNMKNNRFNEAAQIVNTPAFPLKDVDWVSSRSLTSSDDTHFDAVSTRELGMRYADTMYRVFTQMSSDSIQPSIVPTITPTLQPSSNPSMTATLQPSSNPSPTPAHQPSSNPSGIPSLQPSSNPTLSVIPTHQPSSNPSRIPSLQWSSNPDLSVIPTPQPSSNPSRIPSLQPSSNPTLSMIPTLQPSSNPSRIPSLQWTSNPALSVIPTPQPSSNPSRIPSLQPSSNPTLSAIPTLQPSSNPSRIPSLQWSNPASSVIPTPQPSSNPSRIPSLQPSSNPTLSMIPTLQPSSNPSRIPSLRWSSNPALSVITTPQPSSNPSRIPSLQPSSTPTLSVIPTLQPSSNPTLSVIPTLQPSSNPTLSVIPTLQPSSNPTLSVIPTLQPSSYPSSNPVSNTANLDEISVFLLDSRGNEELARLDESLTVSYDVCQLWNKYRTTRTRVTIKAVLPGADRVRFELRDKTDPYVYIKRFDRSREIVSGGVSYRTQNFFFHGIYSDAIKQLRKPGEYTIDITRYADDKRGPIYSFGLELLGTCF